MSRVFAERVLQRYEGEDGEAFRISEVNASGRLNAHELIVVAGGMRNVLLSSWRAKFVPGVLSEQDLHRKIRGAEAQSVQIAQPKRQAKYLIACSGELPQVAPDIQAFLRVETYQPRNRLKCPYPNITDLEAVDGRIGAGNPYHRQAAALLLHALNMYDGGRSLSAYSEEPNFDGVAFYESYGLERDENVAPEALTEEIGTSRLTYVHMIGASVASVRESLLAHDEFLAE